MFISDLFILFFLCVIQRSKLEIQLNEVLLYNFEIKLFAVPTLLSMLLNVKHIFFQDHSDWKSMDDNL